MWLYLFICRQRRERFSEDLSLLQARSYCLLMHLAVLYSSVIQLGAGLMSCTTDTCHTSPEKRWANEGYFGTQGKKRQAYDDLTLTQWVYQIKDPNISKQGVLQVILAMKDATLLPWQAVRSAWATSMHEVEEVLCTWGDTTQWPLNRLSASQIAMANANLTLSSGHQQFQHKKLCNISMKVLAVTNQTMGTIDTIVLIVHTRVGKQHIQRSNITSSQGHWTNWTTNRTQNYHLRRLS